MATCVLQAFAQFGRSPAKRSGMNTEDFVYNGQKYQIMVLGGQFTGGQYNETVVSLGGKMLLIVMNGTMTAYPGADLKDAAGAEDAYKAYQAAHQPPASAGSASTNGGHSQPAKNAVTVDGVVSMLEAGISEDIVIEKIRKSGQTFDLSTDDMVRLKKAKASDTLMKTMMEAAPAPAAAAAPPQASSPAPAQQASAAPPAAATSADPAAKPKKQGFFSSIGRSTSDILNGRSVIDRVGLRNILPQWDPQKPLSEQFPHVAITVLYAPMGWMDSYETDKSAQGKSVLPSCFNLQAVVWSDADHSKTVGPFDWCSNKDEFLAELEPNYAYSLVPHRMESGYITGVNRTDGPAPPEKLIPTDRKTMDMEAATNPQGRSIDLNLDSSTRFALMFANVRKDLGETLTADGDYRVWIVSIKKAAGPSLF